MLDVVLGPLWVWLFYAERPTGTVLVCGLIVLASVLWYLATNRSSNPSHVTARPASVIDSEVLLAPTKPSGVTDVG